MRCEQIRDLLSPYIDKMTNKIETQEIEAHFAGCVSCRVELEQLKSLCDLIHGLDSPRVPDSFTQDLHQRLLEEKRSLFRHSEVKKFRRPGWMAAAVAGLALAVGMYANSILPVGTLAWFNKVDNNQNKPSIAMQDTNAGQQSDDSGSAVNNVVNIPGNNEPSSSLEQQTGVKAVENPVKPESIVKPEVIPPKVAEVCSTMLRVEDTGDSLAKVILIADASGAEFVSTSTINSVQVMSATNTKELVLKVDKSKLDDFLGQLGNVGTASIPTYQDVVLTEQYSKVTNEINLLEQQKQAIESQKDISAADQLKLAEFNRQLEDQTSQKTQLEKELNTVKVTIYLIQQVNP